MLTTAKERLKAFRKKIKALGFDAFIVPTADPHLSEYLDPFYAGRAWLSGFTGSAGALVVTAEKAALVTDSRYWEQAERELDGTGIDLVRATGHLEGEIFSWLRKNAEKHSTAGICGSYVSAKDFVSLYDSLKAAGVRLEETDEDPVLEIRDDKPALTFHGIYEHEASPVSRKEKFELLKSRLEELGARRILITSLEDIAWLTNLRGSDIPCCPVFYGYGIFDSAKGLDLFINPDSLPEALACKLSREGVRIHRYDRIRKELKHLDHAPTIASPSSVNLNLYRLLCENCRRPDLENPFPLLQACKTPKERELIRKAMEKDGAALVRFYRWLDENVGSGQLTELSCAEKLLEFRQAQPDFIGLSFETICAFGPNAALPHYQAKEDSFSKIKGDGFLLIDSGAQFPQGTTDITRTVLVGNASEQMKSDYTAVLRGNIRLAMAKFPVNISSVVLDTLAREPIWSQAADFGHGTGHGVGFFLNVHEGPQRISYPRVTDQADGKVSRQTQMKPGMVTSDEPGIYRPGKWGVRIENLLANIPADNSEFGEFLSFETLTLCPIDLRPVDLSTLLPDEKHWLNEYHEMVRSRLSPYLADDAASLEWLKENTKKFKDTEKF